MNPDLHTAPSEAIYLRTSRLVSYFALVRIAGVSDLTVSILWEMISGPASIIFFRYYDLPSKSGINVSIVIPGINFFYLSDCFRPEFSASIGKVIPVDRSYYAMPKLKFFNCLSQPVGSSGSGGRGLPVFVAQNLQALVHISPRIMKVAVPAFQHSPIFGQFPLEQIV